MLKLIGILIVVIGFVLKLDTIAVVVVAGIVTGLVGGLSFNEILTVLGDSFVTNRYMSVFLISLPVIAILENNGLKGKGGKPYWKCKGCHNRKDFSNIYGYKNSGLSLNPYA